MSDSRFGFARLADRNISSRRRITSTARAVGYIALAFAAIALSLSYPGRVYAAPTDPTMTQVFTPSTISQGGQSTLKITLTNTAALPVQNGLSFTNVLPVNVKVTGSTAPTCAADTVAAPIGGHQIDWNGKMTAGMVSCEITVTVTSDTPNTYANNPPRFTVTNLNVPATATLEVTDDSWGVCPEGAYLFQNQDPNDNPPLSTKVTLIDLKSTVRTPAGTIPDYVNAVGFNAVDGYMWGWDQTTNDLVRIGYNPDAAVAADRYPLTHFTNIPIQGGGTFVPHSQGFNLGDITPSGMMFLAATPFHDRFVKIDLSGATPIVTINGTRDVVTANMADWAFVPASQGAAGFGAGLYGIGATASGIALWYTDPATGARAKVADLTDTMFASEPVGYGAVYLDSAGFLYASNNTTGHIFRILVSDPTSDSEKFSNGPSADGNDGARCAAADVSMDWSDGPNSYSVLLRDEGPRDGIDAGIRIGATNTAETNGKPSMLADRDAGDDGVTGPNPGATLGSSSFTLNTGGPQTITVAISNPNDEVARLSVWLDANRDGVYDDASERTVLSIGAGFAGTRSVQLPAVAVGEAGHPTFLRARLEQGTDIPSITGIGPSRGEIEDYRVELLSQDLVPEIGITKTTTTLLVVPGGPVNYTVVVTNGTVPADGSLVSDPVPYGLDPAAFHWTCTSTPGTDCETSSGTGDISQTIANFAPGGVLTYVISATALDPLTEVIVLNTAIATPPPTGTCAPGSTPPPCTASVPIPTAPSVFLQKNIVSRVDGNDQFVLGITGGTIGSPTTVTTGTGPGIQAEHVGPLLATDGIQYTFTESPGVGTTMSDYSSTYRCVDINDNDDVLAFGSGVTVNLTVFNGQAAVCTFINTPTAPQLFLQKDLTARVLSGDQFDLAITGPGIVSGNTATTTLGLTGLQAQVNAVEAVAGQTYTFTETAAGSTNLAGYSSSYVCIDMVTETTLVGPAAGTSVTYIPTASQAVQCTFTNTPIPPHVTILKSTTTTTAIPGGTIDYTVLVTNTGTVPADNTVVHDTIPAGLTAFSWSCAVTTGAATCPSPSGVGSFSQTILNFPVGSSLTYTVHGTVSANPPGTITNTAVCDPAGLIDPTCTSSVPTPTAPQVTLLKRVNGRVISSDQFILTVTGPGISTGNTATTTGNAPGAQNEQVGPLTGTVGQTYTISEIGENSTALSGYASTWSCVNTSVSSTPFSSGSGTSGTFVMPATVVNAANVLCTFTNAPLPPQVTILKTTTDTVVLPGGTVSYSVLVTNTGPVPANNTVVHDQIPTGLTAFTWTCAVTTGAAACPTASGAGSINETIAVFPVGSSVTYSITALASTALPATVTNTATCEPAGAVDPTCTSTVPLPAVPLVTLQKSVASRVLGGDHFLLTLTGTGIPAGSTAIATAPSTGVQNEKVGPLQGSPGIVYSFSEAASGTTALSGYTREWECINTANLNMVVAFGTGNTGSFTMPAATATSAANVVCTFTNTALAPTVTILKTTPATSISPNGTIDYTVLVTNTGMVPANQTVVRDQIPTGLTAFTWTCAVTTGSAQCPNAAGIGSITETILVFPVGSSVTYTIHATVAAAPPLTVTNTAVCDPVGLTDPTCTSSVPTPSVPTVSVQKNLASRVHAADQFELSVTGADITTGNTAITSGTGVGMQTPIVAPLKGSAGTVYTVSEIVSGTTVLSDYNSQWRCVNTANSDDLVATGSGTSGSFTMPAAIGGHVATVLCTFTNDPSPILVTILKTSATSTALPGGTIDYSVVVTNTGAVPANGTIVNDPIPAGLTAFTWTCATTTGSAVCPNAAGAGSIAETMLVFPVASSVTYSITATVSAIVPGAITNTATCAPGGIVNPVCTSTKITPPAPQVSVIKTADVTSITANSYVIYTVVVSNVGVIAADGTAVSDPVPAGLDSFDWSCAPTGGAVCPAAVGSGDITGTIATFPVASLLTYTVKALVSERPPAFVINTATVTPPPFGVCSPDPTVNPCLATLALPGGILAMTGYVMGFQLVIAMGGMVLAGVFMVFISRRRRHGMNIAE